MLHRLYRAPVNSFRFQPLHPGRYILRVSFNFRRIIIHIILMYIFYNVDCAGTKSVLLSTISCFSVRYRLARCLRLRYSLVSYWVNIAHLTPCSSNFVLSSKANRTISDPLTCQLLSEKCYV